MITHPPAHPFAHPLSFSFSFFLWCSRLSMLVGHAGLPFVTTNPLSLALLTYVLPHALADLLTCSPRCHIAAVSRDRAKRRNPDDARVGMKIRVCSVNNFPTAAGLASSAAGYACLVRAACPNRQTATLKLVLFFALLMW